MSPSNSRKLTSPGLPDDELHRIIIEAAPVGILAIDKKGQIIRANSTLIDILGSPGETVTKKFNVFKLQPIKKAGIDKFFKDTLKTGLEQTFTGPYTSYWGKKVHAHIQAFPFKSQEGKVNGLVAIIQDITQEMNAQKELEELNAQLKRQAEMLEQSFQERTAELERKTDELARSEERHRVLVETMDTGLWVANREEITTYINPGAEEILGYTRDEMVGRSVFDFIASKDREKLREVDRQRYEEKVPSSSYELTLIRKDGSLITTLFHGVGIHNSKGDVVETFATFTDITGRKRAEKEREKILNRLQEIERTRAEFIATVSHETRTPLTVIRGHSELLLKEKKGPLSPSVRNSVGSVLRNARRLERLIVDIVELFRLELESFRLHIKDFNLSQLVRDIHQDFTYIIEERDHSVSLEIPQSLQVRGDPERLSQVLSNLLENAILYTDKTGRITIRAVKQEDGILVSVLDDGGGIPPEHQTAIFERFCNFDPNKGMGLGLAVCKELIERHGGKIWIEKGLGGKGTCVSFFLPSKITE